VRLRNNWIESERSVAATSAPSLLEVLYDSAVEIESPVSVMPSSSSSPPPLPPPQDAVLPRANRRLDMTENLQAADSRPLRHESAGSDLVEESPPSIFHDLFQKSLEEHEQRNGPLPGHEQVGGWLRDMQAANASDGPLSPQPSDGPSLPHLYPAPPAAPRKDDYVPDSGSNSECSDNCQWPRSPPAYIFRDGQVMVHKSYQGRTPFTFVDTGLYEGGRHDWYAVHTDRDLVWAQRLNLVLKRHNIQRRGQPARKHGYIRE
jgi:hypothetical protein